MEQIMLKIPLAKEQKYLTPAYIPLYIKQCPNNIFMLHIKLISKLIIHHIKILVSINIQQSIKLIKQIITALNWKKQQLGKGLEMLAFFILRLRKLEFLLLSGYHVGTSIGKNQLHGDTRNIANINTDNLIKDIVNNSLLLSNPNCIGCSIFYQQQQLPETGQGYLILQYENNTEFEQQYRRSISAVLNNGGGYILLNKTNENKIQGMHKLQHKEQDFYKILHTQKQKVQSMIKQEEIKVDTLQVMCNPFIAKKKDIGDKKFIVRIKVCSKQRFVSYVDTSITYNKNVKKFYMDRCHHVVEVQTHHIYKLIIGTFLLNQPNYPQICPCCLPMKKKVQQIYNQIPIIQNHDQDMPYFKYKNSILISIASAKYQEQMVKKIKQTFNINKIIHFMNKPFTKQIKTSLRKVYFVSYEGQFDFINQCVKNVDKQDKCICVILTRFLKVKIADKRQQLIRMQNTVHENFKSQVIREQKFSKPTPNSPITYLYAFYEFKQICQSIFGYMYLDSLSVRSQFVKQHIAKK